MQGKKRTNFSTSGRWARQRPMTPRDTVESQFGCFNCFGLLALQENNGITSQGSFPAAAKGSRTIAEKSAESIHHVMWSLPAKIRLKNAKNDHITWRPWAFETSTFGIARCDNFWPNLRLEVAEGLHIRWRMLAAQEIFWAWAVAKWHLDKLPPLDVPKTRGQKLGEPDVSCLMIVHDMDYTLVIPMFSKSLHANSKMLNPATVVAWNSWIFLRETISYSCNVVETMKLQLQ